jgi:predicted SAM-dependent methyltransferase
MAIHNGTKFFEWTYAKGDRLPFESSSLAFVYSEHFLEHLFLDEALSLLKECHRVLGPGGVIRTVVPDADLRTYAKPEPVGYPSLDVAYSAREKHKTRWSVYALGEVLSVAGFLPIPLRHCDRDGRYNARDPVALADDYTGCLDPEMIRSTKYIRRLDTSLVMDGLKTR